MAAVNVTDMLPPLPCYEIEPLPPLIALLPDKFLILLLPVIAYWAFSMFFHWIDANDYFSRYRLHTPVEVLKRNRVTRWEVVRDVILQQIIQTAIGALLGMTEPDDVFGKEEYDVIVWARRTRAAQRMIPTLLAALSIDAAGLAKNLSSYPNLAGALSGGVYPSLIESITQSDGIVSSVPIFAAWELVLAKALYWIIVPAIQFAVAIFIVDTWQYFLHRAMHMNKWLYTTFHSRHHRLYVPYAFGALYNHPFEGFLLDTLGAAIAFKVAGMSTRQGMWFFTGSTIKTVDDHCGYALPWDPLQHLTSNNAGYHDVHHQSWGIKTNFSQPFFTFWDHALGTVWTGGDVSARYERARVAAQRKADLDVSTSAITGSNLRESDTQDLRLYNEDIQNATNPFSAPLPCQRTTALCGKAEQQAAASQEQVLQDSKGGGFRILMEEVQEEKDARSTIRRSNRRIAASSLTQSDGLKGLTERVNIHGRAGGILGMDHSH